FLPTLIKYLKKQPMDKSLLRHRTRRYPLYKSGEIKIAQACPEDPKKQKRLLNQWLNFCVWSVTKGGGDLGRVTSVTRDHIVRYGQHLRAEFDKGRFSSTTAPTSYLSGMNVIMRIFYGDGWEKVSPIQDCGLEPFFYIPSDAPGLDKQGLPDTESLAGYLLELQSSLGVVIREALALDLRKALGEGRRTGFVSVDSVQSGARRKVPCRPSTVKALGEGIAARKLQKRLPKKWEFDDFLAAHDRLAARKGYSTNTARGIYVRDRYLELTGVEPPIVSGLSQTEHWQAIAQYSNRTLSEAKGIDKNSRHQIAKEMGVLGIDALKAYLEKKA
ncbi:MAG: hypothetical protein Q8M28_01015, partial [Methylobacter sp.]|nr:hypothetical protein [Methylobacter sp.]